MNSTKSKQIWARRCCINYTDQHKKPNSDFVTPKNFITQIVICEYYREYLIAKKQCWEILSFNEQKFSNCYSFPKVLVVLIQMELQTF